MRDNAEPRRQSLLFAFFFAALDVDIHVVGVSPLLLERAALLPEAAFVQAFAISQVLGELHVDVGANLFDLDYGGLQRLLVGKRKLLHAAQDGDDMIDTVVPQEKAFVDAQLRGTCGLLRGNRGTDTLEHWRVPLLMFYVFSLAFLYLRFLPFLIFGNSFRTRSMSRWVQI